MNHAAPRAGVALAPLPLPDRQYRRFLAVFHVVFIAGLLCSLLFRWRRPDWMWSSRDTALTILVAAQVSLYWRYFIFSFTKSISLPVWGFYFAGAFGLWLVEWRLEPNFEWAVGALLGQLFGVLPPKVSLPVSGVVFANYFAFKFGWSRLAAFTFWEAILGLGMLAAWTALGLFIHKLVVTSSDRARLIAELKLAQIQLELAQQKEVELAALKERERLARELHDSLGHNLVTLSVQLEAVQRLVKIDSSRAEGLLVEMKQLTRTSMEELRRSLAGLRMPGLGERKLGPALQQLCREVSQRAGIEVTLQIEERADSLPPAVSETLWRVAFEGLANAEKHSQGKSIRLVIRVEGSGNGDGPPNYKIASNQVLLQVADDGLGLPADAESRHGHYGLRGLRERVEGVGGRFLLVPGKPKGTVMEARIPLLSV